MTALSQLQSVRRTPIETRRKIRVLVVDDSVVIRRFLARVMEPDEAMEIIGFAANGVVALSQEEQQKPDVITMDIEMPQMDGLAAVSALRARGSKAVIIMCSSLTTLGGASTIEAMIRGANDYVTKPSGTDSVESALEAMRLELIPKIKQFFFRPTLPLSQLSRPTPRTPVRAVVPALTDPKTPSNFFGITQIPAEQREVVALGVSTGGPTALLHLLPRLPATFPLPLLIVQHMPPIFTRQLAERLNAECALEVLEAEDGMPLAPGRVLLAPGDLHMQLKRVRHEVHVTLDRGERENSCRPAVDVLFRSVLAIYGGRALAVVLTGMGQDGLRGVRELKQKGAYVIAQDQASSVVWGMPGAVVEAGLADAVLSLDEVAPAMLRQVPRL